MLIVINILFALVFNDFFCLVARLLSWMRYCEFNGLFITCWSSFSIMLPVGDIFLFHGPCMISDDVWDDLGMGLHSVVFKSFFNAHELELADLCSIAFFTTG